jgi:hypothetical protein
MELPTKIGNIENHDTRAQMCQCVRNWPFECKNIHVTCQNDRCHVIFCVCVVQGNVCWIR